MDNQVAFQPDFTSAFSYYMNCIVMYLASLTQISRIGLIYIIIMFINENLSHLMEAHRCMQQQLLLVRICANARLMLQKKMLRVSSATNRMVSDADLRSIFNGQLYELQHAFWCLIDKAALPVWTSISLYWLFTTFDMITCFSYMGMIALHLYIEYKFHSHMEKKHESGDWMRKKKRELMSQTLKNVKFLKQYGWKDLFFGKVCQAEDDANAYYTNLEYYHRAWDWCNGIYHNILPILTYSVFFHNTGYSAQGKILTLASMQLTNQFMGRIKGIMHEISDQFQWFIDLKPRIVKI